MKKKGKKLISIALTVAMIAGLTACGKGNGGNGNGGSSAVDASLAKQYVFKEQALDLNMDSDNMNIDLLTRKGDTVYLLFETYEYSDNGSQSTLHLTTMKQDGTVIGTVELPMWKEGEAPATPAPAQGGEASGDGNEAVPFTEYVITIVRHIPKTIPAVQMIMHYSAGAQMGPSYGKLI